MKPRHVPTHDFFAELTNFEQVELFLFYESHDGCRPPKPDCIKVEGQVAIPSADHGRGLFLAGAKRQTDAATVPNANFSDLQGMRDRCSDGESSQLAKSRTVARSELTPARQRPCAGRAAFA